MIKKLIFMLILLFGMIANCPALAQDRPVLIVGQVNYNNEGGKLVPEIAVNSDGSWREATLKDVWAGQEFELFGQTQNPILRGKVEVNSVNGGYYVGCKAKDNSDIGNLYWGIYKAKQQFRNIGHGEAMKPKYIINKVTQKALLDKKKGIKARLQNVIKQDWRNIKKEFPRLPTSNLFDFMTGDINGDKKADYVLILSDVQNMKGEAVFIYLSKGKNYTMVPIEYREYGNQYCWFKLDFMMDLNGDAVKEIGILDQDGDTNSLTIYGWFKDRQAFMMLHTVDELWLGG
jgi:hypothetical protein